MGVWCSLVFFCAMVLCGQASTADCSGEVCQKTDEGDEGVAFSMKELVSLRKSLEDAVHALTQVEQRVRRTGNGGQTEAAAGGLLSLMDDVDPDDYWTWPWLERDIAPDVLRRNPQAAHFHVRSVPTARLTPTRVCQPAEPAESSLPTMSVIVSFKNEDRYGLESTVKSVLAQTPARLLKELILVSDANEEPPPLPEPLPPKVRVIHSNERLGMFGGRMRGAQDATGDTLVFLDSHVEATPGWAQPLLRTVLAHPKAIAVPLVDAIDDLSLEYKTTVSPPRGGWEFENLNFLWNISTEPADVAYYTRNPRPFAIPAMPGGLFMVDREWWHTMGAYDLGLDTWGGENVETSIRVWALGGRILMVPCSRVGHIFRSEAGRQQYQLHGDFPYDFPAGGHKRTVWKNMARVVDLWVSDPDHLRYWYSDPVHDEVPGAHDDSLVERRALLAEQGARSFNWYISTVYPVMAAHLAARVAEMNTPGTMYHERAKQWAEAHPDVDFEERAQELFGELAKFDGAKQYK